MSDYSQLSVTIDRAKKVPRFEGSIAVKELVEVTIVGGAQYIADGLTLKIQDKNNKGQTTPIAVFPLAQGDAWAAVGVDDADARCYLNLNTGEALAAFENVGNLAFRAFNCIIYTTAAPALDANGVIPIGQFPSGITGDPVTISQAETIAALTARVNALEMTAAVTVTFDRFENEDFSDLSTNEKRNAAIRRLLSLLQGN